ncbi:MAG: hypothetical protein ACOX4Q_13820 [Syntrophomonadales bacterium]|jgi:hypothetical protein
MADMPNAFTPENIAAVAQHADKILAAVFGTALPQAPAPAPEPAPTPVNAPVQVETRVKPAPRPPHPRPEPRPDPECCCPNNLKFFIFGNTWINNYNATCPLVVS